MAKKLQVKDRLLIVFLVVLGAGALLMEASRLGNIINGNVASRDNSKTTDLVADDNKIDTIIDLQKKDTDKDGLSDYDEMNVYNTSIYIPDSDSDGYSDKQEVDTGNNPNCPAGQDCSLPVSDLTDSENIEKTDVFDQYSELIDMMESVSGDSQEQQVVDSGKQEILSGEASISEVKNMLLSAGMPQDDLSKIPDSEIMKMYLELISGSGK